MRQTEHKQATRNCDAKNHMYNHQLTNHNIDWDSTQCLTYSVNYFQQLTLESWYPNLEQTSLNRCQQLPAPYKQLIHDTVHLILKMTFAQVVEMSVTNNIPFQNYPHPDDHTIWTTDTPGFKPFTRSERAPKGCLENSVLSYFFLVVHVGWDGNQTKWNFVLPCRIIMTTDGKSYSEEIN